MKYDKMQTKCHSASLIYTKTLGFFNSATYKVARIGEKTLFHKNLLSAFFLSFPFASSLII